MIKTVIWVISVKCRWRWRDIHPASGLDKNIHIKIHILIVNLIFINVIFLIAESRLEVPRTCCALLNAGVGGLFLKVDDARNIAKICGAVLFSWWSEFLLKVTLSTLHVTRSQVGLYRTIFHAWDYKARLMIMMMIIMPMVLVIIIITISLQ